VREITVYKGWNAKIYIDGILLGNCESAKVDIATGLEPFYEIGSRTPSTLVEGNQEVTGSFSRAWINIDYLRFVTATGKMNDFEIVFKADEVAGAPWIYCYNCKFEKGAIDIPQDGFLMEDYDFRATSIGIRSA